MITNHTLSSSLTMRGIGLTTEINEFWNFVATMMDDEPAQLAVRNIGKELKKKHLALFVESMLELNRDDMVNLIVSVGGSKYWLNQIELLLNHKFAPAPRVPELCTELTLAAPGTNSSTGSRQYLASVAVHSDKENVGKENDCKENDGHKNEIYGFRNRKPNENLGKYLERIGELHTLVLDKEKILDLCECTIAPETDTLTPNDTKAITDYIFWMIKDKYNDVGGSMTLFRHLSRQLYRIVPKPFYPSAKWHAKLQMRFESGRRTNAKVCHAAVASHCSITY